MSQGAGQGAPFEGEKPSFCCLLIQAKSNHPFVDSTINWERPLKREGSRCMRGLKGAMTRKQAWNRELDG